VAPAIAWVPLPPGNSATTALVILALPSIGRRPLLAAHAGRAGWWA